MRCRAFNRFFFTACLTGLFCVPLAGCTGVEDEPVGVDDEGMVEETDEYIEGEEALMDEY